MTEALDPEVVADLQLRASTERDTSRSGAAAYDWKRPDVIGQWKCRAQCGRFCDVTQDTMEAMAMWNRELKRRLEAPLDINAILWCEPCSVEMRRLSSERRRAKVERMASVIKQIKDDAPNIRYRDKHGDHSVTRAQAFEVLKEMGHPDVAGFQQALSEKSSPNKRPSRGGL